MPQRNGQNPIRKTSQIDHGIGKKSAGSGSNSNQSSAVIICSACKTEVPPKPGFRLSALKCPKCGASMARK